MYLLFVFDPYYPVGGMNDFHSCHLSEESALEAAKNSCYTIYQICSGVEVIKEGSISQLRNSENLLP
jgi:hypothetical protein